MKNISPQEAFEILLNDSNAIMIDVRTPEEWAGGIPADVNLKLVTISSNLDEFGQGFKNSTHDVECKTLFICRGGTRSATAAGVAEKLGYRDCYNITGGFTEWQHLNLPSKAWSIK